MVRRARARMLSPTISLSDQVNRLSLKTALIFTWMLSHADDAGRLTGKPSVLKGTVTPLREDIDREDIKAAILEMETAGLIIYYAVGENRVIQLTGWHEFQMLRDPAPSKYPPPEGWQDKISRKRDASGRYEPDQR